MMNNMRYIIGTFIKEGLEKTLKKYSGELPHEQFLKATTIPDKSEHVFEWNEVPGKDKEKLIEFLSLILGTEWGKDPRIEKIDVGKTIKIYANEKFLSLKLNDINTEVILELDGEVKDRFIATMENNELNIYKSGRKTSEHVRKVVEKLDNLLEGKIEEVIEMQSQNCDFLKIIDSIEDHEKNLLLCAALYHDIGKSIIFPRHGPEGADVIKDSGQKEREQFQDLGFGRYDFYFMSDLIRFHDYLGMLCTGEVSYLIMAETLNPISNISLSNDNYSGKFFDFLFLLNIADIAGSIGKVDREDITIMVHDFKLVKQIYMDAKDAKMFNYDENRKMIEKLLKLSEDHTQERLRRLLRNGFKNLHKTKSEEVKEYIGWVDCH